MRPNTGALCTPVRSEGFCVLFPSPEGEARCGFSVLNEAGVRLSPAGALLQLGEARVHRIRCFRLALAGAVSLTLREDVVLVVCRAQAAGEGLVIDGARVSAPLYLAETPDALLLVLPRAMLAPLGPWPAQAQFGAPGSAFEMLMAYLKRLIAECPERLERGDIGLQLEDSLVVELMRNWRGPDDAAPVSALATARASAVPRHVHFAESYMAAHAASSPTIPEVARAAGVSERVLSSAFRQFRGVTPSAHLRELRLGGVRAALERAGRGESVASIAASWSYVNFGLFARAYANRFGELPSATLRRARHGTG